MYKPHPRFMIYFEVRQGAALDTETYVIIMVDYICESYLPGVIPKSLYYLHRCSLECETLEATVAYPH